MVFQPDQCWTLERVPKSLEPGPPYLLQNAKQDITVGRKVGSNDKICQGANVSRSHLRFVRSVSGNGDVSDWQNIRWSVEDLGGLCGTFVNLNRIEPNNAFGLNCGDLIGIGCPEKQSSRTPKIEKFVYRIKSPEAYRMQAAPADVEVEEDAPTPPPADTTEDNDVLEGNQQSSLPDLVTFKQSKTTQPQPLLPNLPQESMPSSSSARGPVSSKTCLTASSSKAASKTREDSPIPLPSSTSRKRVRRLLSSDEEDTEEHKRIKKNAKIILNQEPPTIFLPSQKALKEAKCNVRILKVPKRAVSASIDEEDRARNWNIVSRNEYKNIWRSWKGLALDGSQGTPLYAELGRDDDHLSDISDADMDDSIMKGSAADQLSEVSDANDDAMDEDFSSISSDEVSVLEPEPSKEVVVKYGSFVKDLAVAVKEEAVHQDVSSMNYSVNDEAVITIYDSGDEDDYNQSQNCNVDFEVDDLLLDSDRDSPTHAKDNDQQLSGGELSDNLDEDDDEIQILNDSQTSLFNAVMKANNIKKEPSQDINEDLEIFSQSLLDNASESECDEESLDPHLSSIVNDIVNSVEGATEKMVTKVYQRLVSPTTPKPVCDEVLPEVIQECENNLVNKLSKLHGMTSRSIKLLLLELKGEDKESIVLEEDLETSIVKKKEEGKIVDQLRSESEFSQEAIKDAVQNLKNNKVELSKHNIVQKLKDQEETDILVTNIAMKLELDEVFVSEAMRDFIASNGKLDQHAFEELLKKTIETNKKVEKVREETSCSDDLARKCLNESRGNVEDATILAEAELDRFTKSKELAKLLNTSVEAAREKLEENDDDQEKAYNALVNERPTSSLSDSSRLSDAFSIPEEEASDVLQSVGQDFGKASQILLDKLETEAVKETLLFDDKLVRSKSPDLMEDDYDNIDDLLGDDEEEESILPKLIISVKKDQKATTEKDKNVEPTKVAKPSSPIRPGTKLIEPLAMPHRKAHLRGISENTVDTLTKRSEPPMPKSSVSVESKKTSGSDSATASSGRKFLLSKEEIAAERRLKLKELEDKKVKKVEAKKSEAPSTAVMKTSVPKTQKFLLELQASTSSAPKRKQSKEKTILKPRERNPSETKSSITQRRSSSGFLEEEAKSDKVKKDKYASTSDGFRTMKKMSVNNVDYNIMSQDISKMPIKNVKPLQYKSLSPLTIEDKENSNKIRKRIQWRDHNGLDSLVDVRFIEANNKGLKCGPGNKDLMKGDFGGTANKRIDKNTVDMNTILKVVVEWKCAWLDEQKKMNEPPPVHGQYQLLPLPSTFSNSADYTKIFLPLMFHELWSSISQDYDEKQIDPLPVVLQSHIKDVNTQFVILQCVCLLTEKEARSDLTSEGTLVKVDLSYNLHAPTSTGKTAREIKPSFGYVLQVAKDYLMDLNRYGDVDRERVAMLMKAAEKSSRAVNLRHFVIYTIKCKSSVLQLDKLLSQDKPIYLKLISRVKPELRKFEALLSFSKSPLHSPLITPNIKTFKQGLGTEHLHATIKDIPQLSKLNSTQKRSIVSVGRTCLTDPAVANVSLIQGPPGTGKSSTIVGLLLQILYASIKNQNKETFPRILVVAPSNAAVDEVARKLISVRKHLPDKIRFRMIRLGIRKSMHEEVQKYSLDDNIDRIVKEGTNKVKAVESLKKDIETKQKSANILYEQKVEAEAEGNDDMASKLNRDWMDIQSQIKKIKNEMNKPLENKDIREMKRKAEDQTIAGADIILSTMSSSVGREMEKYFVQGVTSIRSPEASRRISVCVMDEASQCVEPEALIPLKLGFKKLVMVGDHEQLQATVTSSKAKHLFYHQSLFGRLHSFLSTGGHADKEKSAGSTPPMVDVRCPILRLDTQYRMHPAIALWPNRYFYGGILQNGETKTDHKIVPYLVLDVDGEAVMERGNCHNKTEEKIVIDIVKSMREIHGKTPNMGIITFYSKQKQNISLELQNQKLDSSRVVVNTVDGFQGSEKDVILISCVRGGQGGIGFLQDKERLNVALTRAKKTLIVIGNMKTLSTNPMWANFVQNAQERNVYKKFSEIESLQKVLKCD